MQIVKVGRKSGNDVVVQSDITVSRTHCQFIKDDSGRFYVIDLNSSNGTFINGVRRSGKTPLRAADIVRIGNTTLPWQSYFTGKMTGSDPVTKPRGNGFGIASMVLGILSVWILAIVFGAIGLSRHEPKRGFATAGLVLGIVWAVVAVISIIVISLD